FRVAQSCPAYRIPRIGKERWGPSVPCRSGVSGMQDRIARLETPTWPISVEGVASDPTQGFSRPGHQSTVQLGIDWVAAVERGRLVGVVGIAFLLAVGLLSACYGPPPTGPY